MESVVMSKVFKAIRHGHNSMAAMQEWTGLGAGDVVRAVQVLEQRGAVQRDVAHDVWVVRLEWLDGQG
jgi:hypothetical protein